MVRHPMPPPWIVCAWPPVLWQADTADRVDFIHLGTRVISYGDGGEPPSGQTLGAAAQADPHTAGVAWDWIEVQEGVVAMADPLGLMTNLRLLDASGDALPFVQAAVRLNVLVHRLPWQCEVRRALHAHAA